MHPWQSSSGFLQPVSDPCQRTVSSRILRANSPLPCTLGKCQSLPAGSSLPALYALALAGCSTGHGPLEPLCAFLTVLAPSHPLTNRRFFVFERIAERFSLCACNSLYATSAFALFLSIAALTLDWIITAIWSSFFASISMSSWCCLLTCSMISRDATCMAS